MVPMVKVRNCFPELNAVTKAPIIAHMRAAAA
jgi:hypothetical protein